MLLLPAPVLLHHRLRERRHLYEPCCKQARSNLRPLFEAVRWPRYLYAAGGLRPLMRMTDCYPKRCSRFENFLVRVNGPRQSLADDRSNRRVTRA